jgi:hypothetical protein
LNWVEVVVTGMLMDVKETASVAGSFTVPYTVVPPSLVISTFVIPAEVPAATVTVAAVTVSDPLLVTRVKASIMVAAPPGAMVALAGLVPLPSVVVGAVPLGIRTMRPGFPAPPPPPPVPAVPPRPAPPGAAGGGSA